MTRWLSWDPAERCWMIEVERDPQRAGAGVTSWTAVRMFLRGRRAPSRLGGLARENMLREWAEGSRQQVERVTDAEGRDLDPREVDWAGMDPPPERRAGRPETGRGRDAAQILIRLTPEERERVAAQAASAGQSVAAFARDAVLMVAGRRERLER